MKRKAGLNRAAGADFELGARRSFSLSTKSLPVISRGGNLFFQRVNARYEMGTMILTANRGNR